MLTDLWLWIVALDDVTVLRVAYTTAALLGVPLALYCLWSSIRSTGLLRRAGVNGSLERIAAGYCRRDGYRLGMLLIVAALGLLALGLPLPLRSPLGLFGLLTIAIWTTVDVLADYQERRDVVDPIVQDGPQP